MINKNVTTPSSSNTSTEGHSEKAQPKPVFIYSYYYYHYSIIFFLHQPRTLPSAPSAAQAKAVYDFNASEPSELSFKQGDVLNIISQNGGWWDAEINGRRGQVPANYVKIL